jgi:hypothetical protein
MNDLIHGNISKDARNKYFNDLYSDINKKISGLQLDINKLDYQKKYISLIKRDQIFFDTLVKLQNNRKIFLTYTKKELLNVIALTNITPVLQDIICDYAYQTEYVCYALHNSSIWYDQTAGYKSFMFKNFFIEYIYGRKVYVYVIDTLNGELVNQFNVPVPSSMVGSSFNSTPIYGFVSQHEKNYDKFYLVNDKNYVLHFSITFNENNECKIENETRRRVISFNRYTNIVQDSKLKTKKLNDIIDIEKVGIEISKLIFDDVGTMENVVHFDHNIFNIDSQECLSAIFYVGDKKNPHILEYDIAKKRILNHYMIENYDKSKCSHFCGRISFDKSGPNDEYMNIVYPNPTGAVRLKKVII